MTASQQETVMSYDTVNPANGQVEHTQQTLDAAAIEARLAASAKAFPAWAALPLATRNVAMMLVVLPSWTSFLIRVYAWIGILDGNGVLNQGL
ncbi:aldehyde dehydrogenase family protein, partial [Xanthomonas perforans]